MSIAKNHRNSDFGGRQRGELPPRRDQLGDGLQRAVEMRPRRRSRQLAAGAQVEDRVDDHAPERRARTDHGDVHPHRQQPDERRRARRCATAGCATGTSRRRGSTPSARSGRYVRASPARTPAAINDRRGFGDVAGAEGEDDAPQAQGQPAVPGHRRQPDRRQHVEHGQPGDRGRGDPTPRAGQREQGEDDAEVLDEAERALGFERDCRRPCTSRRAPAARPGRRGGGSRGWAGRPSASARGTPA